MNDLQRNPSLRLFSGRGPAILPGLFFLVLLLQLTGCATVEYKALEKVGVHKRDLLVRRIDKAREAQTDAREQVVSAYERFRSLVTVDDGGLEKRYKAMARAVERSADKANELGDRIDAVESVAKALFAEWRSELSQYSNPSLRAASARNLKTTQARYDELIRRMRSAQARINPVLYVLQDQTLFLKHNLNARAVSSLQSEVGRIEGKVAALISEMRQASDEAERFMRHMETGGG